MIDRPAGIRIGACQLPEIRGDIAASLHQIEVQTHVAEANGVALLCFPECYLQGYFTEPDSARRHALDFKSTAFLAILHRLASLRPTLVIGAIEFDQSHLYNTAIVIERGRLVGKYRKTHLLGREHGFTPGASHPVFAVGGLTFGLNICYDSNFPTAASALATQGARVILCPANNMLPHATAAAWKDRHNEIRCQRAAENQVWIFSSDVTGERDNSISYGPTAAITPAGKVLKQVPLGEVGFIATDVLI